MPNCPSCGREQPNTSGFCSFCGALLDRPGNAEGTPQTPGAADSARPTRVGAPQVYMPPAHHDVGDIGAYIVRRLLALAVDLAFVGTLIALALRMWITRATRGGVTAGSFLELALFVAIAIFVYRWLFEGFAGTTLGKLLFGLSVARADGRGAGLGRTFVRELLLPLDLAIIGFLLAALLPKRQRLGDLVGGTVVLNAGIGPLAPLLGIVLLGGATYGVVTYAGGLTSAQRLAQDASRFGPGMLYKASPKPAATNATSAPPTQQPTSTPTSQPNASPTDDSSPTT